MNLFVKSIGTGMVLLAAAGCAGEGPSQSAPASAPLAEPANPPSAPGDSVRPKMSADSQPPGFGGTPGAKEGQIADSGPAIEGPKVENEKTPAGASGLSAEQLANIKELPSEEQQVAMKQLSCPVSGEPLGSMGKPLKVSAEGRSFYLCCKGCEKDVKADPKGVLAKLDQKRP